MDLGRRGGAREDGAIVDDQVPPRRLNWLDALKGLIVFGILLFHAALVFSPGSWVVNNAATQPLLMAFAGFTFQWGIALMFFLAGAATWFTLRKRSPWRFTRERVLRLGLPFAIGLLAFSPLQAYLGTLNRKPAATMSLSGLLPWYKNLWGTLHLTWNPGVGFGLPLYHMWFLSDLLLIALATLPLAVWLRHGSGSRVIDWMAGHVHMPGALLIPAIPLAIAQMALGPRFSSYQDWSDLTQWAILYTAGFVTVSRNEFEVAFLKGGRTLVVAALAALVLLVGFALAGYLVPSQARPAYSAGYLGYMAARAVDCWAWVAVMVHLGVRFMDGAHRLTAYGAEMSMPFYVLQEPVVVVIAFYVVRTDLDPLLKFLVIAALAVPATLALCEVARRTPLLSGIFGLHPPAPRAPQAPRPVAVAA